jgi:hypothetical protein
MTSEKEMNDKVNSNACLHGPQQSRRQFFLHITWNHMNRILLFSLFAVTTTVSSQSWEQVIKAVASDRGAGDQFGYSVAVSGDYAIIGAFTEDHDASGANAVMDAGSAYIFHWDGSTWTQQQKLVPSDRHDQDHFGYSVGISGDYAIIGARWDDYDAAGANSVTDAGSAYIFVRSGSTWTQQQKLVASDRAASDEFGWSVSISGDYAIVGAPSEDHDAAGANFDWETGSAYLFVRSGTAWTQQQKIVAGDRGYTDQFGKSISLSGDYAIVGTYGDEKDASGVNPLNSAGSAYIFVRSGSTWTQQQKLVASDRASSDFFGYSVSISGDYAVAGSLQNDAGASNAGAAYIFVRSGSSWTQQQKVTANDGEADDYFGGSVALSGSTLVVGADNEDASAVTNAGSAYVFSRSGTTWTQTEKLTASDVGADDRFSKGSAVSGGHILCGAWYEDHDAAGANMLGASGSTYFYKNPALLPAVLQERSASFDGIDDYITMGTQTEHQITTNLTVEAWIKPSANLGYAGIVNNLWETSGNRGGFGITMGGVSASIMFAVTNSTSATYLPANIPALNEWVHVACTYDGTTMRVYVNGTEASTMAKSGNISYSSPNALMIGRYWDDNESYYYTGGIDDVRLWNVVRTQSEIADNRFTELTGSESGLVGYWKLNETSGTTAADETANNKDGTLTNGVSWLGETGLPVELTSFSASTSHRSVKLQWKTANEVNNYGFEIEKLSNSKIIKFQNSAWGKIGFVEGNGTSNTPKEYSFVDGSVNTGQYQYRLKQIDRDGTFRYSHTVEVSVAKTPFQFTLEQNYPNPFNPSTMLEFTVPVDGKATLAVYNILGQEVALLFRGIAEAGRIHQAVFDARSLNSGVYIAQLDFEGKKQVKKLILMK